LGILVNFNVPQAVPLTGSVSCSTLSSAVGLPEEILARVMRYAIANDLFCEPSVGYFGHTDLSMTLALNENVRNVLLFSTNEIMRTVARLPEALRLHHQDGKSSVSAFNVAFSTNETVFDYFFQNKSLGERYHSYLAGRANLSYWSAKKIMKAWDWAALGSGTVVDVYFSILTSSLLR
jgi:6-hydroxytryprostatin B O-methyltransferase